MAGMTKAELAQSLEESLMDSATVFDGDLGHLIDIAVEDYSRYRPRTRATKLQLVAGLLTYDAPEDIRRFAVTYWARNQRHSMKPWDCGFPKMLPRVTLIEGENGNRQIMFDRAPTQNEINLYGREYPYTYQAVHSVGDTDEATSLPAYDRGLLLLRATAEAMRELSIRNVKKPVATKDSIGGQTKNGTPGALYDLFMKQFREVITRD